MMNKVRFDQRFWLLHGVLPLVAFLLLATVFEVTDWALRLSDFFYDPVRHLWPLKRSWWAEGMIHKGGKSLVLAVGVTALLIWGASFFHRPWRRLRRAALYLCLCIGLSTGFVAACKQAINRHCPWDYQRYGGEVPYAGLFEPAPAECREGNCFPAGHASGGFYLMAGYFIFCRRRQTVTGLLLGIGLGSLYGFGQLARGAHFASHNIWTAAICWTVSLSLFAFVFRGHLWQGGNIKTFEGDVI